MKLTKGVVVVAATFCIAMSSNAVSGSDSKESTSSVEYGATNGSHSTSAHGMRQETVEVPSSSAAGQPASPDSSETKVQYSDPTTHAAQPHGLCTTYKDEEGKMRAICNKNTEPESPEPPAEPTVITLTTREAATLIAQGSGITRQPPGPKVIISKAFIVYTDPTPKIQTTTVLDTTVEVEFTPTSYTWNWGDGTTTTTTDPGHPYPHQSVTHYYKHTATGVTTTLTTTWTTRYRPQGETDWRTIDGTITTTETSTPYDLVRIVTYLTDDAEEAQGH